MSEITEFFCMQIALLAVILVLHTYIGLHIIRREIIFCDLVLDQLAAFGVVAGVAVGIQYGTSASYAVTLAAVLFGCFLLAAIKPQNPRISSEAVIGILYVLVLVACLLLADRLPQGGAFFAKTLEGSMLWVSWDLVAATTGVYLVLLMFHYRFRRRFLDLSDNPTQVPHRFLWDFFFFATQGIITVLIVPVAGVLLAYAFLMIPAGIGALFTRSWMKGLVIGWFVGFPASVLGLWYSYAFDSPYGPSLVLSLGAFFVLALVLRAVSSPDPVRGLREE